MSLTPIEKTLIICQCDCLHLTDQTPWDEALTRIGAMIPGKQVEFYHKDKTVSMEAVVKYLLLGESIQFASFKISMSSDLNSLELEELENIRPYRKDLKQGFIDIVVPLIESVCALVIQTVRNFEKPFNYR